MVKHRTAAWPVIAAWPVTLRMLLGLFAVIGTVLFGGMMTCGAEEPFEVVPDVVYGHKAGMALTYDVIKPRVEPNGAAVAFMMSGGWVSGWVQPEIFVGPTAPEGFRHFRQLVEKGYTLVIVRHGSSPYFKVPDAVADVRLALRHLKSRAKDFGFQASRIGVCGASAGGHLSLMLGVSPRGGSPEKESADYEQVGAVVAYFPPTDIRDYVGPSDSFPALDFERDKAGEVSPILYVTPDDPPTLLIHGDADRLVELKNSQSLHEVMQEKGVTSQLIVVEGAAHGFSGESAKLASNALIDWFDKYLTEQAGGGHESTEGSQAKTSSTDE